jgi:ubiquinone/menaquinone biosynthesis C-methylase UbiE
MTKSLDQKLLQLAACFDLEQIRQLSPDSSTIQDYYRINQRWYSLFHTRTDLIYIGISRDGVLREPHDLLEAARTVEQYITPQTTEILELATGRGATSAYLAASYPHLELSGLDLSPGQLEFAYKRAHRYHNYHPSQGDYHDLSRYPDNKFDLVFEIEALCYSQKKAQVFTEVNRVLKPGGVFILLDGYTAKPRSELNSQQLLALEITEKSMVVPFFEAYSDVIRQAQQSGLTLIHDEDVSKFTLPTLRKLEGKAAFFLNRPWLSHFLIAITSPLFSANAIAAYLLPNLIEDNIASYHITVLAKPDRNKNSSAHE